MKDISASFVAVFVCCVLNAQSVPSLLIPSDAVAMGRAGAVVASAPGAFSMEYNPAMSSFYEGHLSAQASYGMWQSGASGNSLINVGATGKIGERFSLGAGGKYFTYPSYTITDGNGIPRQVDGLFSPKEMSFLLGASYRVADCLGIGVNARFATSTLAPDAKANVFAGDVALAYCRRGLRAGISVCNLGSKAKYGENSYNIPTYARAGVSYSIVGITLQAEADYLFSGAVMAAACAEYWWKEYVGVRVGYHYGDPVKAIPQYFSLGLGGQFKGVQLDFAWLLGNGIFRNTFAVNLGYRF